MNNKIALFTRYFVSVCGVFWVLKKQQKTSTQQLAVYSEPKLLFSNFPTLIMLCILETPKVTGALNLPLQTITGCHYPQTASQCSDLNACIYGGQAVLCSSVLMSSHLLNNACSSHSQPRTHLFFIDFVSPTLFQVPPQPISSSYFNVEPN